MYHTFPEIQVKFKKFLYFLIVQNKNHRINIQAFRYHLIQMFMDISGHLFLN